jgi:hypothetical protein
MPSFNDIINESGSADTTVTIKFDDETTESPSLSIAYWSIRGLAAPIIMMCCAAKVNHTILYYDQNEDGNGGWKNSYSTTKAKLKPTYPQMNLPYVLDHKAEHFVAQSSACLMYIGRKCNMLGTDDKTLSQCEQLLLEIYDLRNVIVNFSYMSNGTKEEAETAVTKAKVFFNKLERWLEIQKESNGNNSNPCFLVGNNMSAPDFHLFEMLEQFVGLCSFFKLEDCLKKFPMLAAFKDGFASLEENQFYLNSWLHKELPFNNRMAKFGSLPGPATYKYGDDKDTIVWQGKGKITLTPKSL